MRKSSPLHDLPALPAPPRFDEREGPIEVEADASLRYVILGGLQQNDPNLSPLAQALNHRFAVMFTGNFEERLVGVFGEIRDMGGLSPVKRKPPAQPPVISFLHSPRCALKKRSTHETTHHTHCPACILG